MRAKNPFKSSFIFSLICGIALGIIAKLVDTPQITSSFPIFDEIFGRFGIWVWTAALIAVFSKRPLLAAIHVFAFFVGMLVAYYGYTILFLKFIPKSQILLWGSLSLFTPICGFVIWHIHVREWFGSILASLPLILIFTEWYLTGKDNSLLLIIYLCMALFYLGVLQNIRQRIFSLLLALSAALILVLLIQKGIVVNFYEQLLNI